MSTAPERRADERHPCNVPGSFLADDAGPLESFWFRCQVHDVSAQGCRLTMQRALQPGAPLTINLAIPGSPTSYELAARVAHITGDGSPHFEIGCAFLRRLTDHELETLRTVIATHKGVWAQPTAKDLLEGE